MNKKLFLLIPLIASMVACSKDSQHDEIEPETDVLSDDNSATSSVDDSNSHEEEVISHNSRSLDDAQAAFLAKGVPKVALTRALNFYRENRASTGGLQDSSCLLKPMSETGAIAKNSNRYDPTTIAMLKTGIRNERYIMIVDYTQANTTKRGYLLDMLPNSKGEYTLLRMTISHGYGSEAVSGIPTVFTNKANFGTTLSGFFISASKTYAYSGHAASTGAYSSIGMRLYGVESINNTAEQTSKVSHGAPYNSDAKSGNSAGCPAMTFANANAYMKNYTGGILWYHHTKAITGVDYKSPSCNKSSTLANN